MPLTVGRITFGPKPIIEFREAGTVGREEVRDLALAMCGLEPPDVEPELPFADMSSLHERNARRLREILTLGV